MNVSDFLQQQAAEQPESIAIAEPIKGRWQRRDLPLKERYRCMTFKELEEEKSKEDFKRKKQAEQARRMLRARKFLARIASIEARGEAVMQQKNKCPEQVSRIMLPNGSNERTGRTVLLLLSEV